jgi:hypothetical protein
MSVDLAEFCIFSYLIVDKNSFTTANVICDKYRNEDDPTFDQTEVKERLKGLGPQYIDLNIRDLFKGSGFIEIDNDYKLKLNDSGRNACNNGEF